jgi:hypothetical protein
VPEYIRTLDSTELDNTTPGHYLIQSFMTPFPNINLKSVTSKEVENVIKSLKTKNFSGYDEISTKLKICSSFISSHLTYIYVINQHFQEFSQIL